VKRPKLLVLGGSGQLGRAIRKHASAVRYTIAAPPSGVVDVRDAARLLAFVQDAAPQFVINCAAYTAVDRAESEPDAAFAINAAGAGNVARACASSGARLIHISTDFVFGGDNDRPYRENDTPAPINVYGASKLDGEQLVLEVLAQSCVLRVSWLFGDSSSSFVAKILERARRGEQLRVVDDQVGCPTSADGAADVLFRLIEAPRWLAGLYHYCGSPATTWCRFAQEIVREAAQSGVLRTAVPVVSIATSQLAAAARRPAYSVLDATRLTAQLGIDGDDWRARLPGALAMIDRSGGE
jgi:dTDP-4-dehydrorhamnose reductase